MTDLASTFEDIAKRNAGRPVLTVFSDGSYIIHGALDAEIESRCWPDTVLLNLDVETFNSILFPDLQARTRLYETIVGAKPMTNPLVG